MIVFLSKELRKLNKFKIEATLQISGSKKTYFPPKIFLWKCRCFLNFKGTGHYKLCSKGTHLPGVGGVIADTTHLMNIIDNFVLSLNFEFTH